MNHSKPKVFGPVRPTCPVCGETAYSHGGIHPQCAVTRADQANQVVLKARNAALAIHPKPQAKKQWIRVLLVLYPLSTLFCIIVTANHYWLDGVGGVVTLLFGYLIGKRLAQFTAARRAQKML